VLSAFAADIDASAVRHDRDRAVSIGAKDARANLVQPSQRLWGWVAVHVVVASGDHSQRRPNRGKKLRGGREARAVVRDFQDARL